MGAFHDGKGDLHGITVVVETRGPRLCVGRCDEVTGEAVILLAATARARSYFADIPPSSPSAALLREGQVVAFVPRHAIEGRAPAEVARTLTEAFDFSLRALLVKEEGDTVEMDLEGMAERLPVYCNTLSQRDPLVMVGYTCVRYGAPARAITDRR